MNRIQRLRSTRAPAGAPDPGRRRSPTATLILAATLGLVPFAMGNPDPAKADAETLPQSYEQSLETWRFDRDSRLRSATGWLTIAGLGWLSPGANRFGSAEENPVRFSIGYMPSWAGTILMEETGSGLRFAVVPSPDAQIALDEQQLPAGVPTEIRSDRDGEPSTLSLGRLRFWVVERGGRAAVRIRDPEAALRRDFGGVESFPIDPKWLVTARFVRLAEPLELVVPNILGYADTSACYGRLDFDFENQRLSLFPMSDAPDDSSLFVVFADATNGKLTYGAGRFLSAKLLPNGSVQLDFNKAYNPPCAFNPYTTCPLPPAGNVLPIAVTAGEKEYAGGPGHESETEGKDETGSDG